VSERPLTLTVGGLAGTGTSTLCRLLSDRLALPYAYAGGIFREEAARRGLSLAEFNALCQADPAVDRSLDDRQVELLRAGGLVLEGRMAGWLAHHHGLDATRVWVVCDEDERIRRITQRDGDDPEVQRARTREREASELDRFRRYYGAEVTDLALYDLVLDSTDATPEALADTVLAALSLP
jgi:CMP/dCMP kinase